MRILAALLALLVGAMFSADALAADYPTEGAAIAACLSDAGANGYCHGPNVSTSTRSFYASHQNCNPAGQGKGLVPNSISVTCHGGGSNFTFLVANSCENGVDYERGKCFPTGAECLAMEPLGASYINSVTSSACVGGCEFKAPAGSNQVSIEIPGQGAQTTTDSWTPTGNACPTGTPEPQAMGEPQACVPAGTDAAGRAYTVCIKANGLHCYTGGPGRQICWRPGETGEKTDGPVLQKREVGSTPTPPSSTPPPGTTLDATGLPMTATTTVGGNTFNTTTNNYTTGGPEVNPNQPPAGEPGDGTGSPGGDGEGDEPGSVTGGVNCDDPPVVQGDPILANIVLQTWGTRCAAEGADKVATTGDLYDCSSPWNVTGPEGSAHVVRLQAMREEICRRDADGDGQPDWTQGDAPPLQNDGEPGPGDEPAPPSGLTIGSDLLDMDGFLGAATCPTLGVLEFGPFGSFDLDSEPVWCDLVAIMRAIVLMMAAFTAINILLGRE